LHARRRRARLRARRLGPELVRRDGQARPGRARRVVQAPAREPPGHRRTRTAGVRAPLTWWVGPADTVSAMSIRPGYDDDLRLAHVIADQVDSITMARFKALDLRVETKP